MILQVPMIWQTDKVITDIAMTTNWVDAGVAASCKEKSTRFLERNVLKKPARFIALDSSELFLQSEGRINRLSACYTVRFCFCFRVFFKIQGRKLHAILQKEDNYILPLGETTKMASANTPSAGGKVASQQPGPAACGSSQPTQRCKTYSFNIRPVVLLNKNT